ncbi:type II toxin-antitoxin system ParD family antitoxin, partial [Escherichia coli]|nr:type II toxin-antitoxin system ParD family antitoxin [Escherichia coli]
LEEREQQIKLESLQSAVAAGINSGESKSAEEVFGRLTHKYKKMAEGEQPI